MTRFLVLSVAGVLGCGLLAGCGKQAPKAAPKRPAASPVAAPGPKAPPPAEVPPASKTAVESDPVLARLGLSAEQAKKVNGLVSDYGAKRDALPESASSADRKALVEERNAKVREVLTAEQQPKYDAGLKIMTDYDAKVTKLQQTNYAAMMAVPRDDLAKRQEVSKDYKDKRAVLDAEASKALDEQVGKRAK